MVFRHGVRAAITPIVTLLGLDIGILLGGAILTETVFNIPGIGRYAYNAITQSDLPVIQGTVLFGAFFIVIHVAARRHPVRLHRPAGAVLAMATPLLEVEDLSVHFETEDGLVRAVDGISYTVDRGQTLGIVGESGSGKSVSSLTMMGLSRAAQRAHLAARVRFDGRDLLGASEDDLRTIRGNEIAMIFQDPLSSLHPFYKVGTQIAEGVRAHQRRLEGAGLGSRGRDALAGRHPRAAQARRRLPARVLGRHAPARDDRDGAGQRPEAADRRRADDRARRDRPGADPRADRAPAVASSTPRWSSSPTTSASWPRSPTRSR